jgi:DNA-directed RNA polymerase alpha subunit
MNTNIISLPQEPKYTELHPAHGKVEILGCYPGYGTTLGNAIRRILLSSLEGAAITSVKIKGVTHEFTTIPGVMEDMVQIILNLKQVRFRMMNDEPMKISLKSKGEGKVTAADFKLSTGLEVVNPEQVIATLSDKKAVCGGREDRPLAAKRQREQKVGCFRRQNEREGSRGARQGKEEGDDTGGIPGLA